MAERRQGKIVRWIRKLTSGHDTTEDNGQSAEPRIRTVVESEYPPSAKGQGEDKTKNTLEWAKTIIAILALIISALAYCAARQSAIFAGKTVDNARKTADAARENVATAQAALKTTIENARLDQRAWVTVESIVTHPSVPQVGETYRISVNFRNSGKTPAKDVFANTVVDPVTMPGDPNFSYQGDPTARVGIIAPNGANFATLYPVRSRSTGVERPLIIELLALLQKEEQRLYVHGRVAYADIFRECHWMTFCFYLLAPDLSSFAVCPDHNDTGEEECKDNQK